MLVALAASCSIRRSLAAPDAKQLRGFAAAAHLAYEEVSSNVPSGKAEPTITEPATALLIHGLLGQGRNWRTWGRSATKEASALTGRSWRTVLVDQRCHGASAFREYLPAPHSVPSSAADMSDLSHKALNGRAPTMLIGHSLGGKVALEWLRQLAADDQQLGLPQQVWVLDSNVSTTDETLKSDVHRVLEEVASIPLPVPSREWLNKHMGAKGFSEGLTAWLGSNLVGNKESGGLKWGFDIEGAVDMYTSYGRLSCWDILEAPPRGVTINIVRATRSDRWSQQMIDRLREAEASTGRDDSIGLTRLHELISGHWLHVDNPAGLLKMVAPSFQSALDGDASSQQSEGRAS